MTIANKLSDMSILPLALRKELAYTNTAGTRLGTCIRSWWPYWTKSIRDGHSTIVGGSVLHIFSSTRLSAKLNSRCRYCDKPLRSPKWCTPRENLGCVHCTPSLRNVDIFYKLGILLPLVGLRLKRCPLKGIDGLHLTSRTWGQSHLSPSRFNLCCSSSRTGRL